MKTEDLDNISYDIKNYILMSFLTPVFTQISLLLLRQILQDIWGTACINVCKPELSFHGGFHPLGSM